MGKVDQIYIGAVVGRAAGISYILPGFVAGSRRKWLIFKGWHSSCPIVGASEKLLTITIRDARTDAEIRSFGVLDVAGGSRPGTTGDTD